MWEEAVEQDETDEKHMQELEYKEEEMQTASTQASEEEEFVESENNGRCVIQ